MPRCERQGGPLAQLRVRLAVELGVPRIRARWCQLTLASYRRRCWAGSCPELFASGVAEVIEEASPLEWIPYRTKLDLNRAVGRAIGADLMSAEYELVVGEILATPLVAPLIQPMFRLFGIGAASRSFPRGWSMLTDGLGAVSVDTDERASWFRFDGVPAEIRNDPMFHTGLLATLRAVGAR